MLRSLFSPEKIVFKKIRQLDCLLITKIVEVNYDKNN